MVQCPNCGEPNPTQARFCNACGSAIVGLALGYRDVRKTVTAVFADLVESTALGERLDAESLDSMMDRFYTLARRVFEGHGGSMQEFAGDAVRVLFGVPVLREDDALRAVSAATEFRDALADLNDELDHGWGVRLRLRIGVNTGEAAIDRHAGALGDILNVASRLQQQADHDEILMGQLTYQLLRGAVTAEELAPVSVRGRASTVSAWRLLAIDPHARERPRPASAPLIGRDGELELLRSFFRRTVAERRCHLLIVYGDAGVGKTRLVSELEATLKGVASVLHGLCPPYGPDSTYRPLAQIVRQAAGIQPADLPDLALQRLDALVGGDERVSGQVAQILGLRGGSVTPADTRWALGRVLTLMAEVRPLLVIIDDLHWADPTLIEFIRYVTDRPDHVRLLLVCIARPDLPETRPGWADDARNQMVLTLSPLDGEQTEKLISRLLGRGTLAPDLQRELVTATAGIPLFAEELVSMLVEERRLRLDDEQWIATGDLGRLPIPLSTRTLLDARLEQLEPDERGLLERAAVVGFEFRRAELEALTPAAQRAAIPDQLLALTRKGLLITDPAAPDDGYRFRHVLMHEATYQRMAKEGRAELHERYVDWLEQTAAERAQLDEIAGIAGHHLEQAYGYRVELRPGDEATRALARRAGERLATAGHRQMLRGNRPESAAALLDRAIKLLDEEDPLHRRTLLDLATARSDAGEKPSKVVGLYDRALTAATEAGDEGLAMHASLGSLEERAFDEVAVLLRDGRPVAERALRVFEVLEDNLGLAKAWRLLAYVDAAVGRSVAGEQAAEHAINLAHRAGDERLEARTRRLLCFVLDWGPVPLPEVITRNEEALQWASARGIRTVERDVLNILGKAHAARGEFDLARQYLDAAEKIGVERVDPRFWVAHELAAAAVELLDGNPVAAEQVLRPAYEAAGAGTRPFVAASLARALLLQDRNEEAEEMARQCERAAADGQLDAQIKWRELRAVALARQGSVEAAERLCQTAADLAGPSEQLDSKAQVQADLAEVLHLAGRQGEASLAARRALELYQQKGDLVSARNAELLLRELEAGSGPPADEHDRDRSTGDA